MDYDLLSAMQSKIQHLEKRIQTKGRQINALVWAFGLLGAFNFMAVIIFMGW